MLLEVGIVDSTNWSTEWITSTGGKDGGVAGQLNDGGLEKLLTSPTAIQGFSIAAASSGTLELPNGFKVPSQTVLINAAQSNQNANVLSAPNILTADNEEAEIVVG